MSQSKLNPGENGSTAGGLEKGRLQDWILDDIDRCQQNLGMIEKKVR